MPDYDNTNTGVLFVNDKGDNEKRPDRKGTINIEGVEYTLSGWLKTSGKGTQFLSLKAERKDGQQAPQAQQQQRRQSTPGRGPDPSDPDPGDPCPF